ncbi:MAG: protein-L-isoaspartate(D-aspartate) O-methyltransferase [Gemmatimonadota bacterium]
MGLFGRSGGGDPATLRREMVDRQIASRDVDDERVLRAMREVPRHLFAPGHGLRQAYGDHALPIGHGQTISQPYIVALMTQALELEEGHRVLEVGTGSGYQAAVLAACGARVYTVERIPELHRRARGKLEEAGYLDRVRLRLGDGSRGWPEHAPFDRVVLTAAAEELPRPLAEQLAEGGVLVAPVGGAALQHIYRYRKRPGGELEREELEGARFVPLVRDEEPPEV